MGRLTTVLGFISVAGLFCIQSVAGGESRSYPPRSSPLARSLGQSETSEEVFHAVSNRSPSVVSERESALPAGTCPTSEAARNIRQVSAEDNRSSPVLANPVVFASHPIRQVKYSEQRTPLAGLSGVRNYADLSPSPCQKLSQATPLLIDSPSPLEDVDSVKDPTYLEELRDLAPGLTEVCPSATADNYVAELSSLLHGPSPWILARGSMLDLRPEEPEPVGTSDTYVNELQNLVADSEVLSAGSTHPDARMLARYSGAWSQQEREMSEPDKTYIIPRRARGFCESPGSRTVDGLFAPVSVVGVSGNSTAPPKVPKNVSQLELGLPGNPACSYMESGIPGYYTTRGYGTRRAPRNTYQFHNNPLYFEDANLERCGQSSGCLTTLSSAIQFATMAALLPYQTAADHPCDCVAALPDCPTCQSFGPEAYFPEWSWKAAAVQGAAVTGLIFIIP